jgi:hypothetical protein
MDFAPAFSLRDRVYTDIIDLFDYSIVSIDGRLD